jgi:hypothetical protein
MPTQNFSALNAGDLSALLAWLGTLFGPNAGYRSIITKLGRQALANSLVPVNGTTLTVLYSPRLTRVQFGGLGVVVGTDLPAFSGASRSVAWTSGDKALTGVWTLANGAFTNSDLGRSLVVGVAGNAGTFTISEIVSATSIRTTISPVDETFLGTATFTVTGLAAPLETATTLRDPTPYSMNVSALSPTVFARLSGPETLSLIFDTTDAVTGGVYEIGVYAQTYRQVFENSPLRQAGLLPREQAAPTGSEYLYALIRMNPVLMRSGVPSRFSINLDL